jgi:hypothetical protein
MPRAARICAGVNAFTPDVLLQRTHSVRRFSSTVAPPCDSGTG